MGGRPIGDMLRQSHKADLALQQQADRHLGQQAGDLDARASMRSGAEFEGAAVFAVQPEAVRLAIAFAGQPSPARLDFARAMLRARPTYPDLLRNLEALSFGASEAGDRRIKTSRTTGAF
jgi:hypothetical protein